MSSLTPRLDKLDRNYVINGNMDFWQRGSSFASPSSGSYTADRFQINFSNAATRTISRSSLLVPDVSSLYSLQHVVGTADASVAAGDFESINYSVEGNDFRKLASKEMTLSFYVRSSLAGVYCCAFRNSALDKSYVTAYEVDSINVWEKKVIHLTHDAAGAWLYDNGAGLIVSFALMSGTNFHTPSLDAWQSGNYISHSGAINFMGTASAQINIAQVSLYEGTLEDPEFNTSGRNHLEELSLCQRYYEKSYNLDDAPGAITDDGSYAVHADNAGSVDLNANIVFKANKRATPTMVFYSTATGATGNWRDTTAAIDKATTALTTGQNSSAAIVSLVGTNNQVLGHWSASAEL